MSSRRFASLRSKVLLLAGAILAIASIGYYDWLTGWELNFFLFYTVPILLVAWFADFTSAVVVATLAGFTWWLANLNINPYETRLGFIWATVTQFVYFEFVAIGGAAIRAHQSADRARIEALEKEHQLEQEIVQVSEREQARIGQDLHDGVCQQLAAIGCAATLLKNDLRAHGLSQSEAAEEIEQLLSDAVKEVRSLARGIFPVQMDDAGLSAALHELVATMSRLTPIHATLDVHGETEIRDPRVGMHLYRIAQEALSNAVRHAKAKNVRIHLDGELGQLTMRISDDGKGLPPERNTGGMGLKTMHYRARLIGAEFHLENIPTGGTLVLVRMPRHGQT